MKQIAYILLFVTVSLFSCASAGRHVDAEQIKQEIKIGKSSKDDILKICGEPLSKEFDATEGKEVWHYAYIKKTITPLGVIANRAGIGSEWRTHKTVVDVFFNNNLVIDMRIETSDGKRFSLQ